MTVVMVWNRLACDEPCSTVLAGSLDHKRKGLMNAIILNAPLKEGMVLFSKAFLRYSSVSSSWIFTNPVKLPAVIQHFRKLSSL